MDKWEEVVSLVNNAITKRSYIRLSDDSVIASAVYNKHDGELVLIVLDNNGHTNIVQKLEDISDIGYSDSDSLYIMLENDLTDRIENILNHYSTGSCSFDYMGMATRLAELGEGK
jgi:hypothetical protein